MGAERSLASSLWEPVPLSKVSHASAVRTTSKILFLSVNGEVKLWDFRGPDRAVETWDLFPGGLAAFDVHSQSGVFAGCVTP